MRWMARLALKDNLNTIARLDAVYGSCQSWTSFLRGIKTQATHKTYVDSLVRFMRYLNAENPDKLLEGSPTLKENQILGFVAMQNESGLSSSIIKTRLAAIKLFYEMNRTPLSWTFIRRGIGKTKRRIDKAYTKEQIQKALSGAGPRERTMIILLASTGIREGAISDLNVGHLVPIDKFGIYKIIVYEGYDEQYYTYCTPEARVIVDQYLDYRRRYGEDVDANSPLIREQFDRSDLLEIKHPKRMTTRMIINSLTKTLVDAGVRPKVTLIAGQKAGGIRHEIKLAHGFRKYFDTQMSLAGVSEIWTQILEGHNIGLKGAYLRPSETDLLEGSDHMRGYVAAVDLLTINEEYRLKRELLQKKSELQQKDQLLSKYENLNAEFENLARMATEQQRRLNELEKGKQGS